MIIMEIYNSFFQAQFPCIINVLIFLIFCIYDVVSLDKGPSIS
jgi:hypothetical protein